MVGPTCGPAAGGRRCASLSLLRLWQAGVLPRNPASGPEGVRGGEGCKLARWPITSMALVPLGVLGLAGVEEGGAVQVALVWRGAGSAQVGVRRAASSLGRAFLCGSGLLHISLKSWPTWWARSCRPCCGPS